MFNTPDIPHNDDIFTFTVIFLEATSGAFWVFWFEISKPLL